MYSAFVAAKCVGSSKARSHDGLCDEFNVLE